MGPVRIKKTSVKTPDVMTAKLAGAMRREVAVVREGGKYYFVQDLARPEKARQVPADSMTDCLHASVRELNWDLERRKR